jgi:hypothetical protein
VASDSSAAAAAAAAAEISSLARMMGYSGVEPFKARHREN